LTAQGHTNNIATDHAEYIDIALRISREPVVKNQYLPKILIQRQLSQGDVLLATPIIRKLYQNHQGRCHIEVQTRKSEVFAGNPWVETVHAAELSGAEKSTYDHCINLDLALEKQPQMHALDAYGLFGLGQPLPDEDSQVELFATITDKLHTRIHLHDMASSEYAVVHMRHGTCPSRNLPEAYWREVVDTLLAHTQLKVIQVGMSHEMAFDHDPRLIDARAKYSLQALKVILENAQLYVGVESDTLQVAASTDVPIVAHFTSVDAKQREPRGRNSRTTFVSISDAMACHGCWHRHEALSTSVKCQQGDPFAPPCVQTFTRAGFVTSLKSAVPQLLC
jgi:ADP-heptose:LPS heptosyltransferase